ncbi:protein of unknown function DUF330 [Nitrosococcus watsonii C-113]|uniref:ABC-type transport auxiliary lipoprotein component domain-containing protein n=2 Tax=Nitrosococcus TaxID=1227 RepID=D8KBC4_NITWC|nr:protein of unknown function DUF330 [Nitrosococcus watsonii C-113]
MAAVFMLGACATTHPQPWLYSLTTATSPAPSNETHVARTALIMNPIHAAEFLQHAGIVYETAPHRLNVARQHRWADPLTVQLHQYIYNSLTRQLPAVAVYPNTGNAPLKAWQLTVEFNSFHGRFDGKALVAGGWRLRNGDGGVVAQGSFNQAIPLTEDGYEALVAALSKGLARIADSIAGAIEKLLPNQAAALQGRCKNDCFSAFPLRL